MPELVDPSPKFQLYVKPANQSAVLGSVAPAMYVIAVFVLPVGGPVTVTVGATLAAVSGTVLTAERPVESVTETRAVYVPLSW